jgi:hypothetical protein
MTSFVVRFKDSLYFARAVLYLSVTNLQSVPCRIDSVGFEIESSPEKWTRLFRIDTVGPDVGVYVAGDLRKARQIAYDDLLLSLLNHALNSRDTIEGWVFLDYPDGISIPNDPRFNIRLSDKAGVSAEQVVRTVKRPDLVDSFAGIEYLGLHDLSSFKVGRYRD